MASILQPNIHTFTAGGTIVEGHAVKLSADGTVVECTANTDKAIGVAQGSASSGGKVEVAMPGGGGKVKLGEAVARGLLLVPHTDGTLVKANASGDMVVAQLLEEGASGDLASANIMKMIATAADL